MYIPVKGIQNKNLKRFLEHGVYLGILLVLIPIFVVFELGVVLPTVVQKGSFEYFVHLACATFVLVNIIGNMLNGMMTDCSIRGKFLENCEDKENWTICAVCETFRPPRAWHCDMCNICILKRDHHCTFLASCVGYYNYRYFMFFVMYVFLGMIYAFYYNVLFLASYLQWNNGFVILKFIFPLFSIVADFGTETLYAILVDINFMAILLSGFLFFYHMSNVLNGKITPERKKNIVSKYNFGWKYNIKEVFGERWYLSWITPFVRSPLPGNGIVWSTKSN